jgi:hypothetical protein
MGSKVCRPLGWTWGGQIASVLCVMSHPIYVNSVRVRERNRCTRARALLCSPVCLTQEQGYVPWPLQVKPSDLPNLDQLESCSLWYYLHCVKISANLHRGVFPYNSSAMSFGWYQERILCPGITALNPGIEFQRKILRIQGSWNLAIDTTKVPTFNPMLWSGGEVYRVVCQCQYTLSTL